MIQLVPNAARVARVLLSRVFPSSPRWIDDDVKGWAGLRRSDTEGSDQIGGSATGRH